MKLLIVQARMSSTRLPGKVLKKICGKPILLILLERVMLSKNIDKIVVATTTNTIDKKIIKFCTEYGFDYFCGSEQDVLNRYYNCAKHYNAELIIRITSDCPLIDPIVIDKTISLFEKNNVDYVANTIPPETRRWPDGSDVEVFSYKGLCEAERNAKGLEREHVTFYFWKRKNLYKTLQLGNKKNWANYRYTLDYKEDFINLKKIINMMNEKNVFGYTEEIIEIIKCNFKDNNLEKKFSFGYGWKKNKAR